MSRIPLYASSSKGVASGKVNGFDTETQVRLLQRRFDLLQESFDYYRKLTDLLLIGVINKHQYARLDRMIISQDEETMKMAKKIILAQHTKSIQELLKADRIEVPCDLPSVGEDG